MRYFTREEFMALKRIPPEADAETIERTARAFWYPPYECAYIEMRGHKVEVLPQAVKQGLADLLHQDDYQILKHLAQKALVDT